MVNQTYAECPKCSHVRTRVVLTKRATNGVTIRRRFCPVCDHRWYSVQYPEVVVDKDEIKWVKTGSNAEYVPS